MVRRGHFRLNRFSTIAVAALIASAHVPSAVAEWMWLGGGESLFDGEYASTAAILPLSEQLGDGFVYRYGVDYLRYEYPQDGTTVRGESQGIGAALGYQVPVTDGWFGLYAGMTYRNTSFSPPQPASRTEGTRLLPLIEIDGGRMVTNRWMAAATASYAPENRAYWMRGRLLRRATARTLIGPEFIAHGDREYDARQAGIALQLSGVIGEFDIAIKGGEKRIRDGARGGYGGIELLRHFP